MFLPDSDAWPYTNLLESIYRGNTANTDGTMSEIAAAYRAREERRAVEGWDSEQVQQREGEKSETKEVRRKLPERALKILHLFFQNISPNPTSAQQTDLLAFIHTTIPGAEWFGLNNLRAWFISRRSEGTVRRLLDEVVAVQSLKHREEVQVRAQERQLVRRQRSDEKDIVTCESILYPTISTPKISKLAVLYRNNPAPNKTVIEVWARALKADVEDVRNWVQIHGGDGGGGGGGNNIPPPAPVANSHPQNPPPTTPRISFPATRNVVPQHTPIPWWPSKTASHSTSSSPPSSSAASRTVPTSTSPTPRSPDPQSQHVHVHEAENTSRIPYRRHPVPHHEFRTQYRARHTANPYARVYRPPVEVSPMSATTTTTVTTGEARRPLPFSLSSIRPSSLPSHHSTVEAHLRGRGQLRAIRPRPSSSPSSSPVLSTSSTTITSTDEEIEELFDPATLRDLISAPSNSEYHHRHRHREDSYSHFHSTVARASHPQIQIQPPPHLLRHIHPPPYPHPLHHILAHTHTHSHPQIQRRVDLHHDTSRRTTEAPVANHDQYDHEYASAARSSLSAVVPPDFNFDLGPSVFSSAPLSVRSGSAVPLPTTEDVGPPLSFAVLPPTNPTPPLDPPVDDEDEDDSEPMDLESDSDDDSPPTSKHPRHIPDERPRRNLLAELATFVHERLAHSGIDESLKKREEEFDFDAALGVCKTFYERIRSGVYAGVGRGLVLREVEWY